MIPVLNVYYMLAYAFSVLRSEGYADLASERFDRPDDLYAAILARGINAQVRRGLQRDYVLVSEVTDRPGGRIDFAASVKRATLAQRCLVCGRDEFTEDTYLNRVLRTAGSILLRRTLRPDLREYLKQALRPLGRVRPVDIHRIEWRRRYVRSTASYRFLMAVCRLVIEQKLQAERTGALRAERFGDESQMSSLYERFVREYYRLEHGSEVRCGAPHIPWALGDGQDESLLPGMRTDVVLRSPSELGACDGRTLIIDCKYYESSTQRRFGKRSVHSANLYQIFSYVKNEAALLRRTGHAQKVSGLLLYAKTDEDVQPEGRWTIDGNAIGSATLDLNADFSSIKAQLDRVLYEHFPELGK